jgi:8-oxo-dGTP pyrophosphatase MutT (NUDIX family)
MLLQSEIEFLKERFKKPLPGVDAQYMMAPKGRRSAVRDSGSEQASKVSSVLILLFPDNSGKAQTVLIKRPMNSGVHSGQIALPGGKHENSDLSYQHTALREAHEEIGVPANEVDVVGALTELYIPASNFLVHPFVGFIKHSPQFQINQYEVDSIIPVHLTTLLSMNAGNEPFLTSYGTHHAPCYYLENHKIWGATAMILAEFRSLWGV